MDEEEWIEAQAEAEDDGHEPSPSTVFYDLWEDGTPSWKQSVGIVARGASGEGNFLIIEVSFHDIGAGSAFGEEASRFSQAKSSGVQDDVDRALVALLRRVIDVLVPLPIVPWHPQKTFRQRLSAAQEARRRDVRAAVRALAESYWKKRGRSPPPWWGQEDQE